MKRSQDAGFADAVLKGDFPAAARAYEELPWRSRRVPINVGEVPGIVLEYRHDLGDRLLTYFGGEGLKGAWRLRDDSLVYVVGFDEGFVVNPTCTTIAEKLLRETGIL